MACIRLKVTGTKCNLFIAQSNSKDTFVFVKVDLCNTSKIKKVINRHVINCRVVTVSKQNVVTCAITFILETTLYEGRSINKLQNSIILVLFKV